MGLLSLKDVGKYLTDHISAISTVSVDVGASALLLTAVCPVCGVVAVPVCIPGGRDEYRIELGGLRS
jgi:hypothetical protein